MLTWLLVIDPKSGEETLVYLVVALFIGFAAGWLARWFFSR